MRKAVFPGSFDPFTIGHKDIADRALEMFDALIIGIGYNISKPGLESVEDRVNRIKSLYAHNPKVEVEPYTGLTVDFVYK